jgi:SpoVK/Ycf46/Vps4 family AAA+-type ATPase
MSDVTGTVMHGNLDGVQRIDQPDMAGELTWLRLRLKRRALWLRRHWQHDPMQQYAGLVIGEAQADRLMEGQGREVEARFHRDDPAAAQLTAAIDGWEVRLAEERAAAGVAGAPPLESLTRSFGLNSFERAVLLLCFAPEIDPSFERLYAYVQDDVTRKHATLALAVALFGDFLPSQGGAAAALLPNAPLRRYRLVIPESEPAALPLTAQALRLDERITGYLLGKNELDERVADLLGPVPSAPLASEQDTLVERLRHWLESLHQDGEMPAINLVGPPGAGKRAVARALGDALGLAVLAIDPRRLPPVGAERQEMRRLLEREAVLLRVAYYLDASDLDGTADPIVAAAAAELVERLNAPLLVASRERWQCERSLLRVNVPKPDQRAQTPLWQAAIGDLDVDGDMTATIKALTHQFDLGPTAIVQTVSAACQRAKMRGGSAVTAVTKDDLWQACRELAAWRLDELAQRIEPCHTWDDIALPDIVRQQLFEIAAQVTHRPQVYDVWGFGARLNRGRGISALFAGPSGTGKTMAAEVLAGHLRLDLYRIDLSGVVSKYIGETEKNLRRVFDAAERSGAILFFDEADALFGKRSEVRDSHDRYANIEINYLLQRMEDYRGLAILTTNMKGLLDQAFMRRLRFLIDFPAPDAVLRRQIWERVFPPTAAVERLEFDALARLEVPGGNIKNIAVNAAFLAAQDGTPVRMEHVLLAARREYAKIDKIPREAEFGPYYTLVRK